MGNRVLITTALPYVNNVPHLGNLVQTIAGDVYARFMRLTNHEVCLIGGTDEHGTTTEIKALEEGVTPEEICDKYEEIHRNIYHWFKCSWDCWGRSSSEANKRTTYEIFTDLDDNGYIQVQTLKQAYCPKCERFLADRFVVGMCPKCDYVHARGDQCENCGKLLDPKQLIAAKCKVCKTIPDFLDSEHLFIDLPKLESELKEWVETVDEDWSENAKSTTQAWFKEGLRPRCITRDLKWGISVPKPGFEDKVFYSWFDAPIAYIGITRENREDWGSWWKDDNARLVQFMGKDNIPFHSILFPSFLLGTKKRWTLVHDLAVNEYLNYEGGQFSKSRGIGIFGDTIMNLGIPSDVWRYYLITNLPEKTDTEFKWDDFAAKLNNELVANLGNLVTRVIKIVTKDFNGVLGKIEFNDEDEKFIKKFESSYIKVRVHYEEIRLKDAIKKVMKLSKDANAYFQEAEPWKLKDTDTVRASTILALLVNVIKDLSIMVSPVMPGTATHIQHILNLKNLSWNDLGLKILEEGHLVQEAQHLFNRLDEKEIGQFKKDYGSKSNTFPLNLRVGIIKRVEKHPDADKLYVIKLDVGDHSRQIVSGLKDHYSMEQLVGKHIIVVTNLAHAKLRGVNSEGMLLAAEKKDVCKVLEAPKSQAGAYILAGTQTNNKEEITYEQFKKLKIRVLQNKVNANGHPLHSEDEEIISDLEDGAKIC